MPAAGFDAMLNENKIKPVIVVGGGIGGLIAAINLAKAGIECLVLEKRSYPQHRVCGEYISNEVVPFLKRLDLMPQLSLPTISRFQLSSVTGYSKILPLDLGGFGVSRYYFDNFLYDKALQCGVEVQVNTSVEGIKFENNSFLVDTPTHRYQAEIVIGAFGKRSNLDIQLARGFIKKRSPYVGIKHHVKLDFPSDLIALHNFEGGYCGINTVESNTVNICYLTHRDQLKSHKSIQKLEQEVLGRNPFLNQIFLESKFLFEKPETINEISFENKAPVDQHILMIGDAAGMITPLCGNGMSIAIHSAKLASDAVADYIHKRIPDRDALEKRYQQKWNYEFKRRLWAGRQIQKLFGSDAASRLAINLAVYLPPLANYIVRNTHGKAF